MPSIHGVKIELKGYGERLKSLRKSRNLTQDELAKKLFLSGTAIGDIEKEKYKNLNLETVIRYADFFGVSTDYILGRDNDHKNRKTAELGLSLGLNEKSIMALLALSGNDNEEIIKEKFGDYKSDMSLQDMENFTANLHVINELLEWLYDDIEEAVNKRFTEMDNVNSVFLSMYDYIYSDSLREFSQSDPRYHFIGFNDGTGNNSKALNDEIPYSTHGNLDTPSVGMIFRGYLKEQIYEKLEAIRKKIRKEKRKPDNTINPNLLKIESERPNKGRKDKAQKGGK